MSIFEKIPNLGLILISSIFNSKVCIYLFIYTTTTQILIHSFLSAQEFFFPSLFYFGGLFDHHNSIRPKQPFDPICLTGCLHIGSIQAPSDSVAGHHRTLLRRCILQLPLRAGTKSCRACSFPLPKHAFSLPLFSLKWKHCRTPLAVDDFSSTTLSPIPPSPYKRRREAHNPLPHLFPAFFWGSLAQELALIGAQLTTATTPHRLTASAGSSPRVTPGDVIPRSEIVGTKLPYVCPGCFIHTYSNNMINRFHVQ
jgi:hypothetical protein